LRIQRWPKGLEALKTLDPFVVLYYLHLCDLGKPL
jgi:hypothetical protein